MSFQDMKTIIDSGSLAEFKARTARMTKEEVIHPRAIERWHSIVTYLAASDKRTEMLTALLESHQPDLDIKDGYYETPLTTAAKNGNLRGLQVLSNQSNINMNGTEGR